MSCGLRAVGVHSSYRNNLTTAIHVTLRRRCRRNGSRSPQFDLGSDPNVPWVSHEIRLAGGLRTS